MAKTNFKYRNHNKGLTSLDDSFSTLVGLASVALWLAWSIFPHPQATETTDKLLAASVGITCFVSGLRLLGKPFSMKFINVMSFLGMATFLLGVSIIEHKSMSKEHPMGFGYQVALLNIIIAIFIPYILKILMHKKNRIVEAILWIPALFTIVSVTFAFFQTRSTLLEPGHSEYVLNEMMAPAAGYKPYQEFVPQYAFISSWLVAPLYKLFAVKQATDILVLIFSIGGFLSLLISMYLARKAFPGISLAFLLLFILPFSTPTPGWNRLSFIGPASTLLSGPALRILGGMLAGLAVVLSASRVMQNKSRKYETALAGALSALIFWNNFDFGAAALLAGYIIYLFMAIFDSKKFLRSFWNFLFGTFSGWILVYLLLVIVGGAPKWNLFAWFARQFGGGFGSVTIEIPGPVLMNFPLIMSVATFGIYALYKSIRKPISNQNYYAPLIAAFFGSWATFSLPYYINRSYHAGQMTMLYIPLSLSLIAAISIIWRSENFSFNWKKISHIFLALVTAFPISTILLIPNPSIEWSRLHGGNPDSSFPRKPMQAAIDSVAKAKSIALEKNLKLGYFGEGGNYVHMLTGVESVNIFNSPLDMFQSNASVRLSCNHLVKSPVNLLLLTESAKLAFAWQDGSLCDGLYKIVSDSNTGPYLALRQK